MPAFALERLPAAVDLLQDRHAEPALGPTVTIADSASPPLGDVENTSAGEHRASAIAENRS